MKKLVLLTLALALFAVPSFAACGSQGYLAGGFTTAASGTAFHWTTTTITGCNFYVTSIFAFAGNESATVANNVVITGYEDGGCTLAGVWKFSLTVPATKGSTSNMFSQNFSSPLNAGNSGFCLATPSTVPAGVVVTLGFSGYYGA
jgi:hypothetical protein